MLTISDILQVVGVVIAVGSAIASFVFSRRAQLLSRSQLDIGVRSFRLEYLQNLRAWADETVDAISEAAHVCDIEPTQIDRRELELRKNALKSKLSSLIDRGRWFFPNVIVREDDAGLMASAYRGLRPIALSNILTVYQTLDRIILEEEDERRKQREIIAVAQRHFVSEIQETLDPRKRERDFQELEEAVALRTKNTVKR